MLIYPKTWALFQQERISLLGINGILLLSDEYVYSDAHRDIADIDPLHILAIATLDDIQYSGVGDVFNVADFIAKATDSVTIENTAIITSMVLYRQSNYTDECKLFTYIDTGATFPLEILPNQDIGGSFPQGILVVESTGYTTPSIELTPVPVAANMDAQIMEDFTEVITTTEFAKSIEYLYSDGGVTQFSAIPTIVVDDEEILNMNLTVDVISLTFMNDVLRRFPRRDDMVKYGGKTWKIISIHAYTQTTKIYIVEVVA